MSECKLARVSSNVEASCCFRATTPGWLDTFRAAEWAE
jgi:hypothetical protein